MKKITVFIFLILMSCATCGAFNPPNPERWELLTTTGSILCYFNRESAEITEQPYGRSAKVWVTTFDLTIKIEAMMDWEINLDTKEFRLLTGNIYDEEGNELLATANPAEFEPIPPGSFIEDIYRELGGKETPEAAAPAAPGEVKPEAPEVQGAAEGVVPEAPAAEAPAPEVPQAPEIPQVPQAPEAPQIPQAPEAVPPEAPQAVVPQPVPEV